MRNKFLIVRHYTSPAPDAVTSVKNYGKEGEKLVTESVSFRNNLRTKDHQDATHIFDLEKGIVVKNRYRDHETDSVTDAEILAHYIKEYAKEIATNVQL